MYSKDASIGEKAAALAVSNVMKLKSNLEMGLKITTNNKLKKNKKVLNKKRKVTKNKKTFCFKKLSIAPLKKANRSVQSVLKDARYPVKKIVGKKCEFTKIVTNPKNRKISTSISARFSWFKCIRCINWWSSWCYTNYS